MHDPNPILAWGKTKKKKSIVQLHYSGTRIVCVPSADSGMFYTLFGTKSKSYSYGGWEDAFKKSFCKALSKYATSKLLVYLSPGLTYIHSMCRIILVFYEIIHQLKVTDL